MGHRLSMILTRTGDEGETGLGSGSRVDKDSPPVEALGAIEELNNFNGFFDSLIQNGRGAGSSPACSAKAKARWRGGLMTPAA